MELLHDLGLFFGSLFHRRKRTDKERRNRNNAWLIFGMVIVMLVAVVVPGAAAIALGPWCLLWYVPALTVAVLWGKFGRYYSSKYYLDIRW